MVTALEEFRNISSGLKASGIEEPGKEAEIILASTLGIDKTILYRDNPSLSARQCNALGKVLHRRTMREPFSYITGLVNFSGLTLAVGSGVLIPRPETELLVEEVLKRVKKDSSPRILDLCTGSGCVALALARNLPDSDVYAVDVSEKALSYARENAQANGISNITFLEGSLFGPVRDMRFDIITSNPPYIKSADIKSLQPEIRDWEPIEALDGGEDGLTFYREIIGGVQDCLLPGGFVALELGHDLKDAVEEVARRAGYEDLSCRKDYAGIDRILCIRSC